MFWYMHGGLGWGGWLVATMSFVIFWGFVVWAVFALLRAIRPQPPEHRTDDAEHLLRRRFASGEISEDEYRHALDVLRNAGLSRV